MFRANADPKTIIPGITNYATVRGIGYSTGHPNDPDNVPRTPMHNVQGVGGPFHVHITYIYE